MNPMRESSTFLWLNKTLVNCCRRVSAPSSVECAAPLDIKFGSIFSRIAGKWECSWRCPINIKPLALKEGF